MSNVRLIYPDLTSVEKIARQREDKVEMARDMLKLSTAAYVDAARVNPGLATAAKGMLQRAAIDYVETLVGHKLIDRGSDLTWRRNETDPVVIAQSQQLELMALASKSAQADVGTQYNAQFRRHQLSIAMLYQTAIRYVEALAGRLDGERSSFDRALALEGSAGEAAADHNEAESRESRAKQPRQLIGGHGHHQNPVATPKAKKWVK